MKMTKREAIHQVRMTANCLIEQAERRAQGWDRGLWRDDMLPIDRNASNTIRATTRGDVDHAFSLSKQFQNKA